MKFDEPQNVVVVKILCLAKVFRPKGDMEKKFSTLVLIVFVLTTSYFL